MSACQFSRDRTCGLRVHCYVAFRTMDESGRPPCAERRGPTVVTLCGSTRFKEEFIKAGAREALAGKIVLTCQLFGHADHLPLSDEEKAELDELHLRKIDLSDEILIVNVGGYVGKSTYKEMMYAVKTGKKVRWWEETKPTQSAPWNKNEYRKDKLSDFGEGSDQ